MKQYLFGASSNIDTFDSFLEVVLVALAAFVAVLEGVFLVGGVAKSVESPKMEEATSESTWIRLIAGKLGYLKTQEL